MYKNASYKEKFSHLKKWIPSIVDSVKKDLRNEHLKKDLYFVKKFLSSKNVHKISSEELAAAYAQAIQEEEKGEELAEFISSRWLLQNSDLYDLFEEMLSKVNPDFASIEELEDKEGKQLMQASIEKFGAPATYLFAVLNSVVFSKEQFEELKSLAEAAAHQQEEQKKQEQASASLEEMQRHFDREISRLTDKYEKKLSGLQKKYLVDVEHLKKQVALLQKKLNGKG